MDDQKCKHEACHCKGTDVGADGYCSPSCRQGEMNGGKCACGHPDCQ